MNKFYEKLNKTVFVQAFLLNKGIDYQIDTKRLEDDINKAIDKLNMEKYIIVGIETIISGKTVTPAGAQPFGCSYTEGVLITAQHFLH